MDCANPLCENITRFQCISGAAFVALDINLLSKAAPFRIGSTGIPGMCVAPYMLQLQQWMFANFPLFFILSKQLFRGHSCHARRKKVPPSIDASTQSPLHNSVPHTISFLVFSSGFKRPASASARRAPPLPARVNAHVLHSMRTKLHIFLSFLLHMKNHPTRPL